MAQPQSQDLNTMLSWRAKRWSFFMLNKSCSPRLSLHLWRISSRSPPLPSPSHTIPYPKDCLSQLLIHWQNLLISQALRQVGEISLMQESEGDFLNRPQWPKSWSSQMALVVENPFANAGEARDTVSIPGSGRSPGKGNSNPLPYSCPENSMDRRTWRATVCGVAKSQTRLSTLWAKWYPLFSSFYWNLVYL